MTASIAYGDSLSYIWLQVRFYATGDPAHVGPQPVLNVNASTLASSSSRRRRLSIGLASSVVSGVGTAPPPPLHRIAASLHCLWS